MKRREENEEGGFTAESVSVEKDDADPQTRQKPPNPVSCECQDSLLRSGDTLRKSKG